MSKLTIPYQRSTPKAVILSAEDVEIELFDTHLTLKINSVEETPAEDDYMPMVRKTRRGKATILKSGIMAIETGYDDNAECYDLTIFTITTTWGYNMPDRRMGLDLYDKLTNWLLS